MPWQWWAGYVFYNLGDWMSLFFYGIAIGIIIGGFAVWRRMRKWEVMYKEIRQYANPNGDRRYHPEEISPAMLQLVELMVEKKLESRRERQPIRRYYRDEEEDDR